MKEFHFVAAARWGRLPFSRREHCAEMWARLRSRFKHVLGCVLAYHLHLLVEAPSEAALSAMMRTELAAFSRRFFPSQGVWQPSPEPEVIRNSLHLRRQIRYVHLNPCREGLASDPRSGNGPLTGTLWVPLRLLGSTPKGCIHFGRERDLLKFSMPTSPATPQCGPRARHFLLLRENWQPHLRA